MDIIRKELKGKLEEFRFALEAEIDEVKKNAASGAIPLINGNRVKQSIDEFIYRFRADTSINMPSDTPATVVIEQNKKYDATIISFEDPYLIIATKKDIGEYIGYARLESDLSMLMEKLINRIEAYGEVDNKFGEKMLVNNYHGEPCELLTEPSRQFNTKQRDAVKSAIGRDLTYIWGPPGTGKTTVIGEIIEESYQLDRTVLLVSHTNTAVDGAIRAACKEMKGVLSSFPILRLGQISDATLGDEHPEVTLKHQQEKLSKDLVQQLEELNIEKAELQKELTLTDSTINQCGYVLKKMSMLDEMNEDIKRINYYIDQCNIYNNIIAGKEAQLSDLMLKSDAISRHSILLSDRNTIKEKRDQASNKVSETEMQLQSLNNSIVDFEEKIIYSKKRDSLEETRRQMFTPEKQKSIIGNIIIDIDNIISEIEILKNKEIELNELLYKAENSNFILKAINKIPPASKIKDDISAVSDRKIESEHRLAGLKLSKENQEREYEKILSVYQELASIPQLPQTEELNKIYHYTKENVIKNTNTLTELKNELASYEAAYIQAENKYNEFAKTITFDVSEVLNMIQNARKDIEENNKSLIALQNTISSFLMKYFIKTLNKDYNDGLRSLVYKTEESSREIESMMQSLSCMDKAEIIKKNEFSILRRNEIFERTSILKKIAEEIQTKLAEIENTIIASAKIIGTTLTKAYLSDELHKRKFDTVILDEASMASIPALWISAYLASGRIVIAGDFKQLPPVTMAKNNNYAERWLSTDVFVHSGVEKQCDKVPQIEISSNIIILNEQYRMDKEIASIANYYYNNSLITPEGSPDDEKLRQWYNGIGESTPVNILDTREFHAWVTSVTRGGRTSRVNYLSATLCVALARKLVESVVISDNPKEAKVLIISPYRPHTKRIENLIENEGLNDLVHTGTIHSFQGSEADIVIFDLVVDEPHWKVGIFNHENNSSNRRLFNVAITRARHKLFLVGNINYCIKQSNKESELRRLLTDITQRKNTTYFDAKNLFPFLFPSMPKPINGKIEMPDDRLCLTQEYFYDYFYQDIENAQKIIIIYSAFIANDRLSEMLGNLQRAINTGINVYVITKAPEERGKKEAFLYEGFIKILKKNNIRVIYKKGMHEKLVFIDNDIIWSGSLNVLSYSNTQEVMERRKNQDVFNNYAELMKINEFLIRLSGDESICPICGGELILDEGKNDPFYYRCINNDGFTLSIKQKYPKDGILYCEKCGGEYKFNMIKEPRWICAKDKKHYIKVRKSHLKLPKMLERIPQNDIKSVEEYFNSKEL